MLTVSSCLGHGKEQAFLDERQAFLDEIACLQAENQELTWQRDTANTHAVVLCQENNNLKQKLNTKAESSRRKKSLRTKGELLTSLEAWERLAQEAAECDAKQKKRDEAQKCREDKTVECQIQHDAMNGNETYMGMLSSKNKAELEDIAHALGLPEKGFKVDLIECIKTHLNGNPELQNDSHFSGLYPGCSRLSHVLPPCVPSPTVTTSHTVPSSSNFTHLQYQGPGQPVCSNLLCSNLWLTAFDRCLITIIPPFQHTHSMIRLVHILHQLLHTIRGNTQLIIISGSLVLLNLFLENL